MTILLPQPQILKVALLKREANIGELTIEYKLPLSPTTPLSGIIVFLRQINDPLNSPINEDISYLSGNLSLKDNHRIFLPPPRNKKSQIQILLPLYTTYLVGIASFYIHEHSLTIVDTNGIDFKHTLDPAQNFILSTINLLPTTKFPENIEISNLGNIRVEEEPFLQNIPTYLSERSKAISQQYRFATNFIDEFQTLDNINLTQSTNIITEKGIIGFRLSRDNNLTISDSTEIITGLKSPNGPTTFFTTPIDSVDIFKFQNIIWDGFDVSVFVSTGFNIGDVTNTDNFRLITSGQDLNARNNENTLNLRIDFLSSNSFIKNVTVYYLAHEPSQIYTKIINFASPFNHAACFINGTNLANIRLELSNDGGNTFIEPSTGEGLDYFSFNELGSDAVLKISLFGPGSIDGFSISTGIKPPPLPVITNGPRPVEI